MSRPISDYAIIGDTHSTALVASDGSIDWLCWPRHDSPALLTRLLDEAGGGCASVHLDNGRALGRRYAGDSNILETRFSAPGGTATLTDLMPVHPPETQAEEGPDGHAQSRVLRILTCTGGEVQGMLRLRAAAQYGRETMRARRTAEGCLELTGGGVTVRLSGSHPLSVEADTVRMTFRLREGEQAFLAFCHDGNAHTLAVEDLSGALEDLRRTRAYWESWSHGLRYEGPYREAVVRSALVLKLLTYSPSGAIVAAATTSLPEAVPGNRNFDYRYSWVRDASFTVTAFCNLGFTREAAEYLRFLRDADGSQGKHLKLLYAIDGEVPQEQSLPHLPGWRNVGPVRIGNAADSQQQHDIYGEFMLALHTYLEAVDYQPPAWISEGLVEAISTLAAQALRYRDTPDRGIWELRSEPGHLLHSKALLWVALDRAVKMGQRMGGFAPAQLQEWRHAADALRAEYEREAWNEARGAWMQAYGSEVLDASVLRTVLFDALDVEDPRLGSTLAAVDRELLEGDLVYRYRMDDDGFEGEEATFTACAFWRVGVMALAGRTAPAKALFERLLARANDVGLFAEEIDAATGEQRGNVPQGFTHMCVINHAVRLEGCITQYGLVG